MPLRAPRLCHCGNVVPSGHRCPCHIIRDRDRKAAFDRKRPSARQRGYDSDWQRERAAFLFVNDTCRRPGCGAPATVVDHVVPHRGDRRLFWQRSNWQALCKPCHDRHKQALECREVRP
jgi:5-methylcytosine-specific restriction protein A